MENKKLILKTLELIDNLQTNLEKLNLTDILSDLDDLYAELNEKLEGGKQ